MNRVLLDVDGVLADFIGGALKLINSQWGTEYLPEQVTQFDFAASLGMTKERAAEAKRLISAAPHLARTLDVYPGAIEGVRQLREVADIYIVTSPWNSNPTWTHDRERWLKEHFDIPHSHVIHTSAKHVCGGDFLVDDRTETLPQWEAANPNGVTVQWETLHNRLDDCVFDFATNDWDALLELVKYGAPKP